MTAMTITTAEVDPFVVGDILRIDGRTYKLVKKTTTACAVVPYYWWHRLIDWYRRHIRGNGGNNAGSYLSFV